MPQKETFPQITEELRNVRIENEGEDRLLLKDLIRRYGPYKGSKMFEQHKDRNMIVPYAKDEIDIAWEKRLTPESKRWAYENLEKIHAAQQARRDMALAQQVSEAFESPTNASPEIIRYIEIHREIETLERRKAEYFPELTWLSREIESLERDDVLRGDPKIAASTAAQTLQAVLSGRKAETGASLRGEMELLRRQKRDLEKKRFRECDVKICNLKKEQRKLAKQLAPEGEPTLCEASVMWEAENIFFASRA